MGMSMGMLISPLLGGIVYDKAGYNSVFGMCYALIGLDIVFRLLLVEKKVAARWDPDTVGRLPVTAEDRSEETATSDKPKASVKSDAGMLQAQPKDSSRQHRRYRLPPVLSLLYSRRLLAWLFCALI